MERRNTGLVLLLLFMMIAGCSTTPSQAPVKQVQIPEQSPEKHTRIPSVPPTEVTGVAPTWEPPSRTGNPASYKVFGKRYYVMDSSENYRRRGTASWYGKDFHGKKTSSGVPYNMYAMTAAHKSLPIPTYVRVRHLGNGRSIVVKVNDRGPFVDDRVIDLSYAAATKLDMVGTGTAPVEVVALAPYQYLSGAKKPDKSVASTQRGNSTVYVQVGAFSERQNAERLQHELASYIAHNVRIDSAIGDLHKVRVGPLQTETEAEQLIAQLTNLGINTPSMIYE
ncbi:MAG: septal ring lytic transglycosylase RlpA family protein [Candidatus Competibacteraceae bacterium]|jgi:rare lipoprotein A|nr:septal ring lytic transglycosylase RlpA family protein [Candidatus Competibacteraceae bacterium]